MRDLRALLLSIKDIGIKNIFIRTYIKNKNKFYKGKLIQIDNNLFHNFSPELNFLFSPSDKPMYLEVLNKMDIKESIIADANDICDHKFTFLGLKKEFLGNKIQWNKDYKSGFVWENDFNKCIKVIDLGNNSDVKIPWELSRFQHIFTLGKAYWLTDDERYSEEFRRQIDDWIEDNPVGMSINWCCTMEVAIRAVNWICGYYFFKNGNLGSNFWDKFNKVLFLHGEFIINNLETGYGYNNNHYISDIVGLIWLGLYFKNNPYNRIVAFAAHSEPGASGGMAEHHNMIRDYTIPLLSRYAVSSIGYNAKKAKKWFDFGFKQLIQEMYIQVNEDGTSYEGSTAYHRLVSELFLLTTILCCRNNVIFPIKYYDRLEKMCHFILDITKPNGYAPLIGDGDNGRVIIFSNYSSWINRDFRHVLAIAGEFFSRDDMKYEGRDYKEDAIWCFGKLKDGYEKVGVHSKAYKNGGFYLLKNENFYTAVRCGELSLRGKGGHSHNDQLSFELNVRGLDFIIDPGLFVYTSDYKMRNLFRSTEIHNTVHIKGYEQNSFSQYNLFSMPEETFSQCISFNENSIHCLHYGYKNKCDILHERKIYINDKSIVISDNLIGNYDPSREVYIDFILDKNVEVFIEGTNVYLVNDDVKLQISIDKNCCINVYKYYIAYGYGELVESKGIKILMHKHLSQIEIKIVN